MSFESRRAFLKASGSGFALAGVSHAQQSSGRGNNGDAYGQLKTKVLDLLQTVAGTTALKVWSPAAKDTRELSIEYNASERLFIGSAMKAFVLCERLRQLDSPDVVQTISAKQLKLDASVWMADSRILNPPNLSGLVSERTAMEAMIMHSDNTATDMVLAQTGRQNVEAFLQSAGLTRSAVPDSTRVFFGYVLGARDYKTFTWEELISIPENAPIVNPPLNDVETMASSCDDLVSFYARSLQGKFFQNAQTLAEFKRILTLADAISSVPFPTGVSAFAKGGSIDLKGVHALCVPGAMLFSGRRVYFSAIINWNAPEDRDPTTASAFVAALREILQLVKDRLSRE